MDAELRCAAVGDAEGNGEGVVIVAHPSLAAAIGAHREGRVGRSPLPACAGVDETALAVEVDILRRAAELIINRAHLISRVGLPTDSASAVTPCDEVERELVGRARRAIVFNAHSDPKVLLGDDRVEHKVRNGLRAPAGVATLHNVDDVQLVRL